MNKFALLVRLEAKPEKDIELEKLLLALQPAAQRENYTKLWSVLRLGPSTFAIFDAFEDQDARNMHLAGPIAVALSERSEELLAQPPVIEKADVLAEKLSLTEAESSGPPVEAA